MNVEHGEYPAPRVYEAIDRWIEMMAISGKSLVVGDYRDPSFITRNDLASLNRDIRRIVEGAMVDSFGRGKAAAQRQLIERFRLLGWMGAQGEVEDKLYGRAERLYGGAVPDKFADDRAVSSPSHAALARALEGIGKDRLTEIIWSEDPESLARAIAERIESQ